MKISDTLTQIADTSAVMAVEAALARAEADTHNVFINLAGERALERARAVDAGDITGRLAGVPFVAKDNFLSYGAPTTAASKFLEHFEAPLQATAIEKLEAEGAICIGKVNLDAFAHGGSTENSAFGMTKNAVDDARVAGGSSGGSAVAVALDIVPFALGTDTGGSIRQPASFNGVVGIKPTYGAVSRYGVVAMASGTDTVGVLTKSVEDTETLMSILAGRDARDMTTLPDYFAPQVAPSGKKLGVIKEFMAEGVDAAVRACVEAAIERYKQQGYEIEKVSLPMLKYALAIYYIVVPAEISSNLARYDGVRYGTRAGKEGNLNDVYELSRQAGFMPENKRRIIIGSYVLSSGFFDAYYQKAQKARTLLIREFNELFETYDALIGPVAPNPAFKIGENTDDPLKMYLEDVMTVPASLAGLPAVSVPIGRTDENLPVGLQVIGKRKADASVLAIARDGQEITHG
ncbi:Asp-tRNA(Asn)/Glu-tRNA(Gln) amidotransferase subunit GatA [Candidatus Mycosynbacter amalyticus]|uniref:Glutamyl-tRNA(Gln) amidotransferase subunit A n=1 Tax=Candidatus Mycosynbacter amalyticus TaxID=2665156 RepID=A0A857MU46_9BACT|nr:Asp-tRNA(Asn)/Glu-tRNA(Gln) amidotransferase subunit GatA [Candidatus Mycosynbacter amalyticus]QHN42927.1 Asp-tRNA(Asn)/Glu-tRNA(Gln) amidotransferase subunit GatA [Candidatus Mycosynbacter amalyticus]